MTALAAHSLQALLVLLLQSTVLLLLGLFALHLTRKLGPAVQSLVGHAALAGVALLVLLLPLTGHIQPVVRVEPTPPQVVALPEREGEEFSERHVQPLQDAPSGSSAQSAAPARSASAFPDPAPPAVPTPRPPAPGRPLRGNLLRSEEAGSFWLIVSLTLLLWLGVCQGHLTRLRRTAQAVTASPALDLLAALTPRPPRLLTHPSVHSPFLAGSVHPAIFLPPTYEADFNADALRAIFVHELAHRDRRDNFWTLAARLLTALLWPQPLLWLLVRKMEHISEDACDQAVLAHHCPPRAYADCLLSLATRPSGRRERAWSAGVAPFRSSIGRRISAILSAARRPSAAPTRLFRLAAAACTLLAVAGSVLLLNADATVDLPHFFWAKQQGWSVRPIRVIDLDHPGLTPVTLLPYDITERDKTTIKQMGNKAIIWAAPGSPVSEKTRLETVLAAQPHFFYAEYLLGSWYRQHGDRSRANALQAQALQDAPVVLAGRYEYDDGTPAAGLQIGTTILCYNPAQLKAKNTAFQDIAIRLDYMNVVTDADGCYYLPVFQAIYSQQGVSWNSDQLNALTTSRFKAHADLITPGSATSGTTAGSNEEHLDKGFIAESHVAVLPQTQVRPVVTLNAPFNTVSGTMDEPIPVLGGVLPISWQPYPKASKYLVTVFESRPIYDTHGLVKGAWTTTQLQTDTSNSSGLGQPTAQTSVTLNLAGLDPVFNRTYSYSVAVEAQDQSGETLSHSDRYCFKPLNALAPQSLTKAALAQALGTGFVVQSIQLQNNQVVATVLTPANVQWTPAMDRAVEDSGRQFGLGDYAGWSSSPGMSMNEVNPAHIMRITYQKHS